MNWRELFLIKNISRVEINLKMWEDQIKINFLQLSQRKAGVEIWLTARLTTSPTLGFPGGSLGREGGRGGGGGGVGLTDEGVAGRTGEEEPIG